MESRSSACAARLVPKRSRAALGRQACTKCSCDCTARRTQAGYPLLSSGSQYRRVGFSLCASPR
eukprot:7396880-Alexandrium_andersonii.AAC.1